MGSEPPLNTVVIREGEYHAKVHDSLVRMQQLKIL